MNIYFIIFITRILFGINISYKILIYIYIYIYIVIQNSNMIINIHLVYSIIQFIIIFMLN